jgi:DNA-binding MltR family transcriptional regulator
MAFDNEDEIAFYDRHPHRTMAIALPVIIENHLTAILRKIMRPDTAVANELFQPSGPLGNFGAKIRLGYMLGLLAPATYKDLLTINKIRNEFAHRLTVKTFDDPPILGWIKGMHIYSVMV